MKRLDVRTVALTEAEQLLVEIHDLLMDQGFGVVEAVELLLGSKVPIHLKAETPALDAAISPEFIAYLRDGI